MKGLHFCFIAIISIACLMACNTPDKKRLQKKNNIAGIDSIGVKLKLITNAIKAPVELNVSPDNTHRMFITDVSGKIWVLQNDSLLSKPFLDINDKLGQQKKGSPVGSIFSVAFHPQFKTNSKFYVCYNAPTKIHANACKLVVSEFIASKSNPDLADLASEHRVLELEGKNIGNNGAKIGFGPDGYLYISIGDDRLGDSTYKFHAQDLGFLNGKLLRIDVNKKPYAIPLDNPFFATKNARPEIWAYGFRKLWRFSFDPATHQLFGGDVGEDREEEIDIVQKGANYGWPVKEGDSSFLKSDSKSNSTYTSPIISYTHKDGICVIGGSFYYGKEIPALRNKYVFGDFNGSMFALMQNTQGNWIRQPLKIFNKPADPFLICGWNVDENNELFVMGLLNSQTGGKGAVYKIVKI